MDSLVESGYGSDDYEDDRELPSATALPSISSVVAPSVLSSGIEGGSSEGQMRGQSSSMQASSSHRVLLPDVSELFGPGVSGAPALTADSHQRKRPAVNGSGGISTPHTKLPRGALQPSRIPPDTAGGLLRPPQLSGRSNIATEDLDKIFSRRKK